VSELSSLEQPKNKPEKPTLEEKLHEEYPKLESRLTFTWPLSERRREAIKMLNSGTFEPERVLKLLKSSDFVERKVGLFLIKECSPILTDSSKENYAKIQSVLEKMSEEMGGGYSERKAVAQTRIKILVETEGEKALPILEKMLKDNKDDYAVKESVIPAFGCIGEKALPILERTVFDDNYHFERRLLFETMGDIGEKALPVLEKMSENEECLVRRLTVYALGRIGEKALPILEKMSENENSPFISGMVIRAKIKVIAETQGKKALPILEKMSQDKDFHVSEAAKEEMNRLKQPSWLEHQKFLRSRKPLFATPYTKELAQRIIKVSEIAKDLQNKFGDKFIGLTIFGSTAKGYFKPGSDLDWGIIAKDKEVSEYFRKKAASLNLCFEHYVQVDKENKLKDKWDVLFYGLFFGNRQKLLKLQEKTLETLSEGWWDDIRKFIMGMETDVDKAIERFGLQKKELEKIKQFALLLRVPPPYQEALNAIRSQRQKLS